MAGRTKAAKREITIGITGKYTTLRDSYASIIKALEHAGTQLGAKVRLKWIETTDIEDGKITAEEALKDVMDNCSGPDSEREDRRKDSMHKACTREQDAIPRIVLWIPDGGHRIRTEHLQDERREYN